MSNKTIESFNELTASEREQVLSKIVKSGILLSKCEPDEVLEIDITIVEQVPVKSQTIK